MSDDKGWISAEERLPGADVEVLTVDADGRRRVNWVVRPEQRETFGLWYDCGVVPITHWRPLPELPK